MCGCQATASALIDEKAEKIQKEADEKKKKQEEDAKAIEE
jgi:hypothetical protein